MVICFRALFPNRFIVIFVIIVFLFHIYSEKEQLTQDQVYTVKSTPSIFAAVIRQKEISPEVVSRIYKVQ